MISPLKSPHSRPKHPSRDRCSRLRAQIRKDLSAAASFAPGHLASVVEESHWHLMAACFEYFSYSQQLRLLGVNSSPATFLADKHVTITLKCTVYT